MASATMQYPYQKNWFERNWKWVVGLACAAVVSGVCAFLLGVFELLGHSQAARMAVEDARLNAVLLQKLGQPIERGFPVTGHVNLNNSDGDAALSVPISGPKGKATLAVEARKTNGLWTLITLMAQVNDGSEEINLLASKEPEETF
jgi:hypothetical protein